MKINILLILLFTIGTLIFGSCNRSQPTNPEYEIYSKILSAFKANTLVIRKYTAPIIINDYDFETLAKKIPDLQRNTFDDFIKKYKNINTLENLFDTKKRVIIIDPKDDIKQVILSQKDYVEKDIRKIKIQGTTTFSSVGFNKSMTQALVCDWTQTGFLGGSGYISLFIKRNKKWKLKASLLIGIS